MCRPRPGKLSLLRTGKQSALLETYLLQRDALKRFLIARLGAEAEAEDLVQELYFRLDRAEIAAEVENPLAYLYKMAFNLARDHRRERQRSHARDGQWVESRRVLVGNEPIADQAPADVAYEAKEDLARIVAALDDLSPQCRRVFLLHKFDGLSHSEIAARVGISRSTVEKHMGTGIKHLLKRLGRI
jgi:RNA polymerase sigma factor (sigma-70 family)